MIGSEQLRPIPWFAAAVVCIDRVRCAVRARARVASSRSVHRRRRSSKEVGGQMKTLMLTLFACAMAACGMDEALDQNDDDATATDEQGIIGGTTDNGDAGGVGVFAHAPGSTPGSICTGTIIGPHTVLTAAHCASPVTIGYGQQIDLLPGTQLALPGITTSARTFNPAWNVYNLQA